MCNRCPASLHLSSAEKEADITLKTQHKQELIRSKCFVLRDSKKFFLPEGAETVQMGYDHLNCLFFK